MTPKQLKAIQLLANATPQKQVASELGLNPKTIERWLKIPEFKEAIANLQSKTLTKMVDKTADKMSDEFSEITLEHLKAARTYRKMSEAVAKLGVSQLIKNPGVIDELLVKANVYNAWNLILDRSIKIERTALGLDYHDVSLAIAFLQRLGYEVSDPTLQPVKTDGEAVSRVVKGLTEEQLNQIRSGILAISEN